MVSLGERLTHGVMIIPGLEYQEDFSNYGGRKDLLPSHLCFDGFKKNTVRMSSLVFRPGSIFGRAVKQDCKKKPCRNYVTSYSMDTESPSQGLQYPTLWILSPPSRG